MKICIIDGMGGGIGAQVVSRLKQLLNPSDTLIALGVNATATAGMMKAGAETGATGENAIIVTAPTADVIIGPIGIIIPNSLLGEISPAIATAVASCSARKILVPIAQPHVEFAGMESKPLSVVLDEVVRRVQELEEG